MKFNPEKTVFIIDGSSFLYRAYYGTRPLHTPQGTPVQAVYSFCRTIKKLVDTFSPHYCALVWDSKGKTTRHEMYEEYKATRQAPPSDLFVQKEYIIKFADLIGLKQVQTQGLEADDIMYSLAKELSADGFTVVLVTSDKDMGQTLTPTIFMYDAFKEAVLDKDSFEQKMGFPVAKLPFYFAILGDTSDNIPGVKGIGEKGATELVTQFASLDDVYKHIDAITKNKMREALLEQKDNAYLSERLFLLQYYPTGLTKDDVRFNPESWSSARPLFEELAFKSLLKDLAGAVSVEKKLASMAAYDFKAVTTEQELKELCALLSQTRAYAMDTETDGLEPLQNTLVGLSFCVREGQAFYVPCGHRVATPQLSREQVITALKPLLEDPTHKKYLHNVKFDQEVLAHAGINLRGVVFDTMIAANLVTQDWQRIGLKYLSEHYFNESMLNYDDMVTAHKRKDFSYVPIDEATRYAAADAHQTFKLVSVLQKQLDEIPTLKRLYEMIEFPLVDVLARMEMEGIYVDAGDLQDLNTEVTKQLDVIESEILEHIGQASVAESINLNSPKQIEQLLFYELKLPPQKKSAKGSYSTDQEVLETLTPLHPVPGLILRYRELFKLKSTYIEALPLAINPDTEKVHTTFSQINVATGRLSSSDPNLQNIPASGYGVQVRAAFKPEEGHSFLSTDYSQIELRVLAEFSQDPHLLEAFMQGHDIHAQTASKLFDVPLKTVTHDQRQIGKRINFSVLYGLTPFGLSQDLGIPFKDAKQYISTYFAQYPAVAGWMEEVVEETKRAGYVQTYYGRRRSIPAIHEKNKALYEEARRVAINTKAQGTAAEIMKLGMIAVDRALHNHNYDAHIVLQIHDELLISVDDAQKERVAALIKKELESVVDWKTPLEVTTRFGKNWKEVTK
ncbi:MAG: DNA polymerase I [Candidatus Babeliales bacterium]